MQPIDIHSSEPITYISEPNLIPQELHRLAASQHPRKKWLLVQPVSTTSMMVDSGKVSMPLNLLMVATIAGQLFDVSLIDERLGDKVPEDLTGFDVVAITSRTLNAKKAYKIAEQAKSQGKIVILGGVHPTMLSQEALVFATTVVYGEIESVWADLATDVIMGTMKPLYRAETLKPMTRMLRPDFSYALQSRNKKNTAREFRFWQRKDALSDAISARRRRYTVRTIDIEKSTLCLTKCNIIRSASRKTRCISLSWMTISAFVLRILPIFSKKWQGSVYAGTQIFP